MWTIVIEALTPLDRTSCIKMYKNNARSRLFCRIAKRSITSSYLIYLGISIATLLRHLKIINLSFVLAGICLLTFLSHPFKNEKNVRKSLIIDLLLHKFSKTVRDLTHRKRWIERCVLIKNKECALVERRKSLPLRRECHDIQDYEQTMPWKHMG